MSDKAAEGGVTASAERGYLREYAQRVGYRDEYMWRWIDDTVRTFQLSCVEESHEETVHELRLRLAVFFCTLDDLADRQRDRALFEAAARIPDDYGYATAEDEGPGPNTGTESPVEGTDAQRVFEHPCYEYLVDLWTDLTAELRSAPRHEEFAELFVYDVRESVQATRYGTLVERLPEMGTYRMSVDREPASMLLHALADIDLAYAPEFDIAELSDVRDACALAAPLARIGNWVTTWERELHEGDLTSGVFTRALGQGVIDPEEVRTLTSQDEPALRRRVRERIEAADIEAELTEEWHDRFERALERDWSAETVDLERYVRAMRDVYARQVHARGRK